LLLLVEGRAGDDKRPLSARRSETPFIGGRVGFEEGETGEEGKIRGGIVRH
jgi:hypothetical protein